MNNEEIQILMELEFRNEMLDQQIKKNEEKLIDFIRRCQEEKANECQKVLLDQYRAKKIVKSVLSLPNKKMIPVYVVPARLLYQSQRLVMRVPEESLHYASGVRAGNTFVLTHIAEVDLDRQSFAGAAANNRSSFFALRDMDNFGELLLACFHSHPGHGASSTRPSSTDHDYQKRLESGDYPTIGGIFSRDGYLRFYSVKNRFKVVVMGDGVKHVQGNLYRLTELAGKGIPLEASKKKTRTRVSL